MRPTITEQLRETRRIIADAVLPQLEDGYTLQVLKMALDNLEMLEGSWSRVLPFLHWDNGAALAALKGLRDEPDFALLPEIMAIERVPLDDPFDIDAVQALNESLQELVCRAIEQSGDEGRQLIHAYLLERTARFPMRPNQRRANTKDKQED